MFPLDLLTPAARNARRGLRDPADTARLLEAKCRELAAAGYVRRICFGPLVTTFEFDPAAGRLYRNIEGVADDLAAAVQAGPVLIQRARAGSLAGIQIPNPGRETIGLREMLESRSFQASMSTVTVALGRTTTGEPYVVDLASMPHLLMAGSRGAGKSAGLLALVTSILYCATPDEVRLVLIDPVRSGLEAFDRIPHLLTPVVVDRHKASNALQWATREMERRFRALAAAGVRNVAQYNRTTGRVPADEHTSSTPAPPKPLPSIVIVISELADLMMTAPFEVETAITRLAQMSRPVGIHLVVATGHFSVGVLTGLVKANLPARVAYQVRTSVESRAILDCSGAERLLGRGDMLFLPPASGDCVRLHGPYITEADTSRVAEYLRRSGSAQPDPSITADDQVSPMTHEPERDPLYGAAAHLVRTTGSTSVAYLQRQLGIGFSRAARLLDCIQSDNRG